MSHSDGLLSSSLPPELPHSAWLDLCPSSLLCWWHHAQTVGTQPRRGVESEAPAVIARHETSSYHISREKFGRYRIFHPTRDFPVRQSSTAAICNSPLHRSRDGSLISSDLSWREYGPGDARPVPEKEKVESAHEELHVICE